MSKRIKELSIQRPTTFGLLLAIAVALSACVSTPPAAVTEPTQPSADIVSPMQLRAGQIIVAFPGIDETTIEARSAQIAQRYGVVFSRAFPLTSIDVDCAVFNVTDETRIDEVVAAINDEPGVTLAQRNQGFEVLASDYNDPYASYQSNIEAIGADLVHYWSTGENVAIAVVDTGMDTKHPDIAARVAQAKNFVQGGDASFTSDQHGTAVAGIIAAGANNGVGIFGVAPGARVLAAKACWYPVASSDKAVCSSWSVARAIDFAINADAQIINLSLGGPEDPLITNLLDQAYRQGVISVAAAGRADGEAPRFPAALPTVIAVIDNDTGEDDNTTSWSDAGLVLAAPGKEILTTTPMEGYNFLSGSSLSTAHVSGAIALLLQRHALEPDRVIELLRTTARQSNDERPTSTRMLDICAAMNRLEGSNICS